MSNPDTKKEIATTVRWGVGIMLAIVVQTIALVWYMAQLDSMVKQHALAIQKLESGSSVYISREQLDDLLGARDEKTANIERALLRIEGKLDKAILQ